MATDPQIEYAEALAAWGTANADVTAWTQRIADMTAALAAAQTKLDAAQTRLDAAKAALAQSAGVDIFNGTGPPSDTVGVNGDYYVDMANGSEYQKANGPWF